ncbi:MAG: helix-turn-helix domain-containing protein [Candidatus Hodarchaeota archaeon]
MQHFVAIGEASIRFGVCRTTIRRWDKDGKIHCYRTPGGHRPNCSWRGIYSTRSRVASHL